MFLGFEDFFSASSSFFQLLLGSSGNLVLFLVAEMSGIVSSFYFCTRDNSETLPNFIKRKHPRKGEKKKQGARTKVQASKQPKKRRVTKRQGNH